MIAADDDAQTAFDAVFRHRAPALDCRAEDAGDHGFLADLFVACSPLTAFLPLPMVLHQAAMQRDAYAAAFPAAMRRIVLRDGLPIGRLAVDWDDPERDGPATRCIDIAVLPHRRATGAGPLLLAAWLAVADARGQHAWLEVRSDNPAMGLYERLGFVADATGPHLPIVTMTRRRGMPG